MIIPTTVQGRFVMGVLSENNVPSASSEMGIDPEGVVSLGSITESVAAALRNIDGGQTIADVEFFRRKNGHLKRYTIPIYSGIIGVLIPEKKLIPLNLMPLELEFSMNPYALYCL